MKRAKNESVAGPRGTRSLTSEPELNEEGDPLALAIQNAMAACQDKREEVLAEQLMLPFFGGAHVVPNAFLRCALFPAADHKLERPYLEDEALFSVGSLRVTFTGKRFDQSDLDVLLAIIDTGSRSSLGNEFEFSAYSVLKALGKPTGGKQYKWLHAALIRLNSGTIEVRDKRRLFFGSLIEGGFGDQEAREYTVRINPRLGPLFGLDQWSQVDRNQRRALGKNGTAKALHGYYSSHAKPGAHKYETLARVAGLRSDRPAALKRTVVRAHAALADPKVGFLKSYKAGDESIAVVKTVETTSQRRHKKRSRPAVRR